ncbi:MAG: class I SAM-dependent methyltransferase [Gammaproteobacteria bacterium]|nr:class I SAM-dependent methyltransferase [Gammaproteobacteria bacterium]
MKLRHLLYRLGWRIYRALYLLVNVFSRANIMRALEREIATLEARPSPARVLSVGASGIIGDRISQIRGAAVTSLDIDASRKPDIVADITAMPELGSAEYDCVFLMEVLEHVREPDKALAEIRRVMRDDGVLLLSSPFIFEAHDLPHDYYRYTRQGLSYLLRDFRHAEIYARNGYLHSAMIIPLRLIVSPYASDKILASVFIALLPLYYPLVFIFDKIVRAETATSGYIARCTK